MIDILNQNEGMEMVGMAKNRKIRKDFDTSKEYSVDVSMCSEEEKKEVQQAFFDVGIFWVAGGHEYQHLDAAIYTNVSDNGDVTDDLMYNADTKGRNMTAEEFLELVYEPEKQEMKTLKQIFVNVDCLTLPIGEKRKVRKDFDLSKRYRVDVSVCSKEEKKEVQQAFFDSGFVWESGGSNEYQHLHAMMYTNTAVGVATNYCLFGTTTNGCNMSAKEFLSLVYEPENRGHVHAESMALYAEDAKTHAEPWKLWQIKNCEGVWVNLGFSPAWDSSLEYRRKPKTHFVHGVEIPDLRVTQKHGDHFYLADSVSLYFFTLLEDDEDDMVTLWIERGLVYQGTEEGKQAAILHAKTMLGIA